MNGVCLRQILDPKGHRIRIVPRMATLSLPYILAVHEDSFREGKGKENS